MTSGVDIVAEPPPTPEQVGTVPIQRVDWRVVLLWSFAWVVGALVSPIIILGGPMQLGILQWLLLKRYVRGLNGVGWVGLSTLGVVVGPTAGFVAGLFVWGEVLSLKRSLGLPIAGGVNGEYAALGDNEAFLAAAATAGLVGALLLGLCQWPVLRVHVSGAWRWIPIHALAGLAGGIIMAGGSRLVPSNGLDFTMGYVASLAPAALGILVCGAVTGIALQHLLNTSLLLSSASPPPAST